MYSKGKAGERATHQISFSISFLCCKVFSLKLSALSFHNFLTQTRSGRVMNVTATGCFTLLPPTPNSSPHQRKTKKTKNKSSLQNKYANLAVN